MLTQNHVKDGDANTDGEINHDTATFLGLVIMTDLMVAIL